MFERARAAARHAPVSTRDVRIRRRRSIVNRHINNDYTDDNNEFSSNDTNDDDDSCRFWIKLAHVALGHRQSTGISDC
jgi:hypothetical protein